MIDLHSHSTYSDGPLPTTELIYRTKIHNPNMLVISGHSDTYPIGGIIQKLIKYDLLVSESNDFHSYDSGPGNMIRHFNTVKYCIN